MSFTKPEVVALMAKLADMFEQVKTARAFRDSLEKDMIVLKEEKNYREYCNADLAYRSVNHAYYDGIEELRALIDARDAEEAEAARATNSQQSIQSN